MGAALSLAGKRVLAAATAPVTLQACGVTGASLLALGCTAVPFGLCTGFLERPEKEQANLDRKALGLLVRTAVFPSLMEEVIWRAAVLPHIAVDGAAALAPAALVPWAACWLALFVLYHVPGSFLLSKLKVAPGAAETFLDWRFLVLATLLGSACTAGYLGSGGVLWVPMLIHWLPVCSWLLFLGGEEKLRGTAVEIAEADM